ncbi:MAG: hypothetical protein NZV14_01690 [Bryobacteraceae bacterium]|nr:hypothetical protein [Bryobacteraceae bacterium]MDW8376842.1 hypothetical protein [Bryobacterales bacterium]
MRAVFILAFGLLREPVEGADLSGIWTGQIATRNNEKVDIAFQFQQHGDRLQGKLYGDYRSSPIVEGKVEGDRVTFVVIVHEQAGNQINETRLRFTGALKNGELELVREREQSTNAGNRGAAQSRSSSAPVSFRLKKLI